MSIRIHIDDNALKLIERMGLNLGDAIARGVNQIGKQTGEEVGRHTGHVSGRLAKSFIGRPLKAEGRKSARAKMVLGRRAPIYANVQEFGGTIRAHDPDQPLTFQAAPGEWRRASEVSISGKHFAQKAVAHEAPRAANTLLAEIVRELR